MPIRERAEPEAPEAGEGLIEFINNRRAEQAQHRRQRILIAVIAALGLITVLLTVANVILVRRLPTRTAALPGLPAAPAPARTEPPRASDTATTAATRTEPPPPSADTGAPSPSRRLPSPMGVAPTPPPATSERPPSPAPPLLLSEPRVRESVPADTPSDSAGRTASWLVQTYGRIEAENRALRVAEFYSGERRAFWRRVLDDVRRTPEP